MQTAPTYTNESVVRRLQREERMSPAEADGAFRDMLAFLDMAAEGGGPHVPTRRIDAAWHAFILHTRDYTDYCERRFGGYLHHQPRSTAAADPSGADCSTPGEARADCGGKGLLDLRADCLSRR